MHTQPDPGLTIRKSNSLVEARYRLNMWEMRVFMKMISLVKKEDTHVKEYRIQLREIMQDFGLDNNRSAYSHLRKAVMTLYNREVEIFFEEDGKERHRFVRLISSRTEDVVKKGEPLPPYIDVGFDPRLKPVILDLKGRFTLYKMQNILNLPSTYLIRLYEILKQYEKIGSRTIEFEELKRMIGAIETWTEGPNGKEVTKTKDYFPLYGNFKQKVLNKGVEHFATTTDIIYTFEPIKQGRKVTKIRFKIMKNPDFIPATPVPVQTKVVQDRMQSFLDQLKPYGVGVSSVKQWVGVYSDEAIQKAVTYTINKISTGSNIKNVGGYIRTMLEKPDAIDPVELQRKKKQEAVHRETERIQKKQRLQEEYSRLNRHLIEKQENTIREIFDEDPGIKQQVFVRTTQTKGSGYTPKRSTAELMKDGYFRGVFRNTARTMFPDRFDHLKDLEQEVRKLRGQISRL